LVGWGEDQGVFDEFGEEVGEVGGGGAHDGGGFDAADGDALVVLDFAEGGADGVGDAYGGGPLRGGSMPASTRSDSALRRMRVARWSSRNRLARVSGSVSLVRAR
jgi:hypothetical protein